MDRVLCLLVWLAVVACFPMPCCSQPYWGPVGLISALNGMYYELYTSQDGTWIAYGGLRDFDPDSSGVQNMLVKISGSGIEYIPVPGQINSMVEYHDTLFIGGHFETNPFGSDTIPAYNVEYWNGAGWSRLGVFDQWSVSSLRVLDDTLYAVGSFTEVDGISCHGMVRLINGQWHPLTGLPPYQAGNTPVVTDIIKHNGHLVIVGTFYIGVDFPNIAYLAGDTWHTLGPGLEAGFSSIHSMAVYDGDLYLGGQISVTANNPGKDIMRWDGIQFHALGTGLRREFDNYTTFTDCRSLTVHNGLLYAGGGFRYAGNVESLGVASWDGSEWCSVPGNLTIPTGAVKGIGFLQDSMFVICGYIADGDSVNMAAKFIGESFAGPCESDVSVADGETLTVFNISPNPATTRIKFTPPLDREAQANILDALGRVVLRLSGQVTELDVSSWPRGVYMVHSDSRPPSRFVLN